MYSVPAAVRGPAVRYDVAVTETPSVGSTEPMQVYRHVQPRAEVIPIGVPLYDMLQRSAGAPQAYDVLHGARSRAHLTEGGADIGDEVDDGVADVAGVDTSKAAGGTTEMAVVEGKVASGSATAPPSRRVSYENWDPVSGPAGACPPCGVLVDGVDYEQPPDLSVAPPLYSASAPAYVHETLSRAEAERLLCTAGNVPGMFLVRRKGPSISALSMVVDGGAVKHHLLRVVVRGGAPTVLLNERPLGPWAVSVSAVVEHYLAAKEGPAGTPLGRPLLREPPAAPPDLDV